MDQEPKPPSALFTEKARFFSLDYLKCCIYVAEAETPREVFTKKLLSKLIATSRLLEDFLDFHGAKNSREWFFYRELSAVVLHLSLAGYDQMHISNRLPHYYLTDIEEFQKRGEETLIFITETLKKIAPVILDEARRLGLPRPEDRFRASDFPRINTGEMLAYTIEHPDELDRESEERQKKNIVKIASELMEIEKNFDQYEFYEPYTHEEICAIVPAKINEVEIRRFEMLIHNLQSSFDTYVVHGGYRPGTRKFNRLRGHFSVVFHLLKFIGRLLHFYERHLHDPGVKDVYKRAQDRLAAVVDKKTLLDRTINYGLFYACHYITSGKELSLEILNENIARSSISVGIPVELGFHSRPSLMVAKIVQHYGGQVELCVGEDRFDASSVLDIQWAGGKINKENITEVVFEGDTRALQDIEILAGVNYGEDSMGKDVPLPDELGYL
ncbi:MAG: HPr family phosphocarrier protein [Desulfobacterales bacterium]|nr:HPr family phosphocarrier protein [Desulfobacterales bacterium]